MLKPERIVAFTPFEAHQLTRGPGGHSLSRYIPPKSFSGSKYQFQVYPVGHDGRLLLSVMLEPHEVRLIHLKKK